MHVLLFQGGWTPLYSAAIGNHLQVVELLLSNGAEVNSHEEVSINTQLL